MDYDVVKAIFLEGQATDHNTTLDKVLCDNSCDKNNPDAEFT